MRRNRPSTSTFVAMVFLCLPLPGMAQAPKPAGKLAVEGHPGTVPVVKIGGRTFVEVDALARLLEGTIRFGADQITLTIPARSSEPDRGADAKPKDALSTGFLKAGIEGMTSIREWRVALVNGIQTGYLLSDQYLGRFRRTAESQMALAAAAAANDSDRSALALLNSEFGKMQKLSAAYMELHQNQTYIAPDALDSDPLDQQILECARGLTALATEGRFRDVGSCH